MINNLIKDGIINESDKEKIRTLFLSIKTPQNLIELFNYITDFKIDKINLTSKGEEHSYIELRTLNYILYGKGKEKSYTNFYINKKSGGQRSINAPKKVLKRIQRKINLCLQTIYIPKPITHGFSPERNIITNAKKHVNRKYIFAIDIQDFFGSIHFGRVKAILKIYPFYFDESSARMLANLICNNEGRLPQGGPTSPVISNFVCRHLDDKLLRFAKAHKCSVTRYADDIVFSSNTNVFNTITIEAIVEIITTEGFTINPLKTRIVSQSSRQEVTGIIVNKKLNVRREYIKEIKFWLKILQNEKYNLDDIKKDFEDKYINSKGWQRRNEKSPKIENCLAGRINYIGLVRGKNDKIYKRLYNEYQKLFGSKSISSVLKIWKENGWEKACEIYDIHLFSSKDKDTFLKKLWNDIQFQLTSKPSEKLNSFINEFLFLFKKEPDQHYLKRPIEVQNIRKRKGVKHPSISIHKPYMLTKFLDKFRNSSSYLKPLVHDNDLDINNVLLNAKKEIKDYRQNNGVVLPTYFYNDLNEFIKLYETKGIQVYEGQNLHPYLSTSFRKHILHYKRSYRFGIQKDEETNLRERIIEVAQNIKHDEKHLCDQFLFMNFQPNIDDFDLEAHFFTDVYRVIEAIRLILSSFLKHSKSIEREIIVSIEKRQNKKILKLCDKASFATKGSNNVIGGDTSEIINKLWGICDLYIEGYKRNKHDIHRLQILPNNGQEIVIENCKGFSFEMQFYLKQSILFVEDDEKRIRSYSHELEKSIGLIEHVLEFKNYQELNEYSLVAVHGSYVLRDDIIKEASLRRIPVLIFSGGKSTSNSSNLIFNVGARLFYENIIELEKRLSNGNEMVEIIRDVFFVSDSELKAEEIFSFIKKQNITFPLKGRSKVILEQKIGNEIKNFATKNRKEFKAYLESL